MKKVMIVGSTGRMGKEIRQILETHDRLQFQVGVSHDDTKLNNVAPKQVDVVIDFSSPKSSLEVADWCAKNKIPLVCGTTGFSEKEMKTLLNSSKKTAVLYSSNMSLGVAVLRRALRSFAAIKDFDFQIVETHHNKKKDSPSGTAKTLQTELEDVIGRKAPEVLSVRGGGVFGIHQVLAMGEEETLQFEHTALNRAVFARGAVMAAEFLLTKKSGLFSMDDMLGAYES